MKTKNHRTVQGTERACLVYLCPLSKILQIKWYKWNLFRIEHVIPCGILRTLWTLPAVWDSDTAAGSCHRVSFVVSVRVLICFFSRRENSTRRSSDVYFHSVLPSYRQKTLLILLVLLQNVKLLRANDWKVWIECSGSRDISVQHRTKSTKAVSRATFTPTLWCFSTVLWI